MIMKFKKAIVSVLATTILVPSMIIFDTHQHAKAVGNYYYNGMENHNASAAYNK